MADYKKSTDHLANAALATPIILATGNIPAAIVALGLGKVLDMAEDRDFERRRKEYQENVEKSGWKKFTSEENQMIRRENEKYASIINEIPQIKEAQIVRTGAINWEDKETEWVKICCGTPKNEQWIRTMGRCPAELRKDGFIRILRGYYGDVIKEVPATLYYMAKDFVDNMRKDINKPQFRAYKIRGTSYKEGKWMYTIDGGKSYVVGL